VLLVCFGDCIYWISNDKFEAVWLPSEVEAHKTSEDGYDWYAASIQQTNISSWTQWRNCLLENHFICVIFLSQVCALRILVECGSVKAAILK
jgi:hypothetical protein